MFPHGRTVQSSSTGLWVVHADSKPTSVIVSSLMELISPDRWNHVNGLENLADCATCGLFPSELLNFTLWDGPKWLQLNPDKWPKQSTLPPNDPSQGGEVCLHMTVPYQPLMALDHYSTFTRLLQVMAWLMRSTRNSRARKKNLTQTICPLSVQELNQAKSY